MDIINNPEIIWLIAGILLLLLEFAVPGILIVFFGFGALITALLTFLTGMGIGFQLLSFTFFSLLFLVLLRKKFMKILTGSTQIDPDEEFIGRKGVAETDIKTSETGRVFFRGTRWDAISDTPVSKGQRVTILNKDGLTLIVKPD